MEFETSCLFLKTAAMMIEEKEGLVLLYMRRIQRGVFHSRVMSGVLCRRIPTLSLSV